MVLKYGIAGVLIGGILNGSFVAPMKKLHRWNWENTWLVYSVSGLFIIPWISALLTIPNLRRKLIDFAVVYAPYGHDRPASEAEIRERMDRGGAWDAALCYRADEKNVLFRNRGTIRNIRVTRLRVTGGALPYSVLAGFDHKHGVSDVILDDIEYQGRRLSSPAELKLVQDNASGVSLQ